MTGEEKRRLLKEQYKRDLKKRKEFLEGAKRLRHTKKMNDAVSELASSLTSDDSDEWIAKLNEESALSEAKMELHLEEADSTTKQLEQLAKEAEAERFSAELMVLQMKKEMGVLSPDEKAQYEKLTNPPKPKAQEGPKAEAKEEAEKSASTETQKAKPKTEKKEKGIEDMPDRKLGDF